MSGNDPTWRRRFTGKNDRQTVRADCIPFATVATSRWNEDRSVWEDGEVIRGWRSLVADFVLEGFLRPGRELSRLIGEDTEALARLGRGKRREE